MIVKNEEKNIKRCLDSVKDLVDEIVIVDTGSTDKTVEISRSYGANIYSVEWHDDFSEARNKSLDMAHGKWILFMDADDELDKNDLKKVKEILNDDDEAYFFKTVNFVGNSPSYETAINMNLRIMRNRPEYRFIYPIHEQIAVVIQNVNPNAKLINTDIKVYHYGYLNYEVQNKNKRKRNMSIINKVLKNNPQDPFMRFNLGNEYFALEDYSKALDEYMISLKNTFAKTGYLSKLYVRIVLCLNELGRYNESIKMIENGISYYQNLTDLYFLKGYIFHIKKRYTIAERMFKKCIEMGDAPDDLGFIAGTGSYRAYYALGKLYLELEDYDVAYKNFVDSYNNNRKFKEPLYDMSYILLITKPLDIAMNEIEKYLDPNIYEDKILLIKIFMRFKRYDVCLKYLNELILNNTINDEVLYLTGNCFFNLKNFNNAYKYWSKVGKDSSFYENIVPDLILLNIIKKDNINEELKYIKKIKPKLYDVMLRLMILSKGEMPTALSDDEKLSSEYEDIIFEILERLLYLEEFDIFEKGLNLLNLINDNKVLLRLGKLYYKYGFYQFACDEILRSMKLFNIYDKEALAILDEKMD